MCFTFIIRVCRWILLEVLDKVSPGSVNWKQASKPPIKMPFRKVENCNQIVRIGKQLKFSLVNVAGNDIVQGNKKLILGNFHSSICPCVHLPSPFAFELSSNWINTTLNFIRCWLLLSSIDFTDYLSFI